jgi:hypothetical protein
MAVGERIVRAWRVVRRDGQARVCGASGWQLRAGCTDGDGGVICPVCSQRVRTQPHALVRHRVEVIEAHSA